MDRQASSVRTWSSLFQMVECPTREKRGRTFPTCEDDPALIYNYAMSAEQVAFFTVHEDIGEQVMPIDALVLARYQTLEDRRCITHAVRLSHEFELLFYHTIVVAATADLR